MHGSKKILEFMLSGKRKLIEGASKVIYFRLM